MAENSSGLKRAVLWEPTDNKKVRCKLCSFGCLIKQGQAGRCLMRKNIDGTLYSLNYYHVCAANPDPIEKKPLFHFMPGSSSFSIAAPGCNFRCDFCQNWHISQMAAERGTIEGSSYTPAEIVQAAIDSGCKSIAYTYTEPTVFMELAADCAVLARKKGLANVFVSNGYMSVDAIEFARGWLDGINIDLKAFSEDYYSRLCHAQLQPVLDTIHYIAHSTDIWMELTTLIVPGENDSDDELKALADFIVSKAGPYVPWHVSRFYPNYHLEGVSPTPQETLYRAYEIGRQAGLNYVYLGNLPGAKYESTFCPACGTVLIERTGYHIRRNVIAGSKCPKCTAEIDGVKI